MKNIIYSFLVVGVLFSCASQNNQSESKVVTQLIANKQFTFMATRANPLSYELNSYMARTAINNLSYGYSIVIKESEIDVDLPYFGEMYSAPVDRNDSSFRFTTKDYVLTSEQTKKGNTIFKIVPNDVRNILQIDIEVFKNGKGSIYVNANDRKPISYDGYIMKNEMKKQIK